MKHPRRTNRISSYGLPPRAETSDWSAAFGVAPWSRGEEVGLTRPLSRYRSVLVPVDGEPFGEHALPFALGIARRAHAEVRIVHVHRPPRSVPHQETRGANCGLDARHRRQQAYLADLVRRIAKVTSVPVTQTLIEGREVADSLREAVSAGGDLVVMASHGRGLFGRYLCGSVADGLLRQLSVPLLVVQGYNAPADLTADPLVRNILIPLGGSKSAEQVLEPALGLGTLTEADHTLLRVIPLETDRPVNQGGATQRALAEGRIAEAQSYLQDMADRLERRTIRAHPRIVLDEQPPAPAILHSARVHDADLIALTTRGRGGVARLFPGSVADRVIRGATVPVLVVRSSS